MPPPQEVERLKKKESDKRRGKTAIFTSSPYKAKLEAEEKEKNEKINQKRGYLRLWRKKGLQKKVRDKRERK